MKTFILLCWLFPIVIGIIQGTIFRIWSPKHQTLYHIGILTFSICIYTITIYTVATNYHADYSLCSQMVILALLGKYLLYDKAINLAEGKLLFYYGTHTIWDKFWSGTYLYNMKDGIIKLIYLVILKSNIPMQIISLVLCIILTIKFCII